MRRAFVSLNRARATSSSYDHTLVTMTTIVGGMTTIAGASAVKARERVALGAVSRRKSDRRRRRSGGDDDRENQVLPDVVKVDDALKTVTTMGVSREQVLASCASTSLAMLGVGYGMRLGARAIPVEALGGDFSSALPLVSDDVKTMIIGAIGAATVVTIGRIALLQVWEEFAASTDRSNAQVLGVLDGPLDIAQVAALPALGEEMLFRGAVLPLIGGVPGVVVSSVVFGALHIGGGRSAAFGVWASAVGACYGATALYTGSVAAPAAAHALANIASAVYWNATRADKVVASASELEEK